MRKKSILTTSLYLFLTMFILSDVSANIINTESGYLISTQVTGIFEKLSRGRHAIEIKSTTFSVDGARLSVNTQGTDETNVSWEKTADTVNQDSPVIMPVPAPPAVWLFGTGLIFLIGLGRRKY